MNVNKATHFQQCSTIYLIRKLRERVGSADGWADFAKHCENVENNFFKCFEEVNHQENSFHRDHLEIRFRHAGKPDKKSQIVRESFCNEFEKDGRYPIDYNVGIDKAGVDMIAAELIKRMKICYEDEAYLRDHCDKAPCPEEQCVNNYYVKRFHGFCREYQRYLSNRLEKLRAFSKQRGLVCLESVPEPVKQEAVPIPASKPVTVSFAQIAKTPVKEEPKKIVVKDDPPKIVKDTVRVRLMRAFGDIIDVIMPRDTYDGLTDGDDKDATELVKVTITTATGHEELIMPVDLYDRIRAPSKDQDEYDLVRVISINAELKPIDVIMYRYVFDSIKSI